MPEAKDIQIFENELEESAFADLWEDFEEFVNSTAISKGWYGESGNDKLNHYERLFLIISEVCESGEARRKNVTEDKHIKTHSAIEVELADTVIRIMDYAFAEDLDVVGAMIAKAKFNTTRPYRHGNLDA